VLAAAEGPRLFRVGTCPGFWRREVYPDEIPALALPENVSGRAVSRLAFRQQPRSLPMDAQPAATDLAAIARWSGVQPPNQAAQVGLRDFAGLLTELEKLRGGLGFEQEPADFEQALRDCREPAR